MKLTPEQMQRLTPMCPNCGAVMGIPQFTGDRPDYVDRFNQFEFDGNVWLHLCRLDPELMGKRRIDTFNPPHCDRDALKFFEDGFEEGVKTNGRLYMAHSKDFVKGFEEGRRAKAQALCDHVPDELYVPEDES